MPTSQYEIPHFLAPVDTRLGWLLEAAQEGEAWLKTQQPTQNWEQIRNLLSSVTGSDKVEGLSNVGYNPSKKIARELVASLSNFKNYGEFTVTWDQALFDTAQALTNCDRGFEYLTETKRALRDGLQLGVGFGTAYFHQVWDPSFHSPFMGDVRLTAHPAGDVTFVQLPKDHNLQRAYMVILREELPINLARAKYGQQYPAFVNALVPDRLAPSWFQKGLQKVQRLFRSPALAAAGRLTQDQDQTSYPTVDIYHAYTLDNSINEGFLPVEMGKWGTDPNTGLHVPLTNWSYKVPALGDPINSALINPDTHEPWTTPAGPAECRLFPLRRYTIWSKTAVAYDNTSPWWHGKVPIARLRFNDWAWEALGSSLIGDQQTMQDGIVELMRLIEDSAAGRLNPARIYDENRASRTFAETFNPRRAGAVASADLQAGPVVTFPVPPEYYNVPDWITKYIHDQETRMANQAGLNDMLAIAKAQQIPGADTLEKLLEMAGPIVQDLIGQVAEPLQQLGEMRLSYYFQFYTRGRMVRQQGPDGVPVDWQFKPEMLQFGDPPIESERTPDPTQIRQRNIVSAFRYDVSQSGINEINRMTTKLLYLQILKIPDFPMDWWTVAKVLGIPNFGPTPKDTNTVMERWVAQKRILIDLAIAQQEQAAEQMAASGLQPPGGPEGAGGGQGGPPGSGGGAGDEGKSTGSGPRGGRPSSFGAPPRLESKDGGSRTTIATSR